jgi:hypothetical protein
MSDTTLSLSTPDRQGLTEDWVSLGIGLFVLALALAGTAGPDLLGWVVSTSVWTDVAHALAPSAKSYAWLGGDVSLLATYVALTAVLGIAGRRAQRACQTLRDCVHCRVLDCLCRVDHRQLRAFRRGHAGRLQEIRHRLVAPAHQ